jgi:hypothetical protein
MLQVHPVCMTKPSCLLAGVAVWDQNLLTYCLWVCTWLDDKPLAGVSPTGSGCVGHRSVKGQDTVDVGTCGRYQVLWICAWKEFQAA